MSGQDESSVRSVAEKLHSEDGGERSRRGFATSGLVRDPLACGEGPRLSMELLDWELGPCEGFLARGSNKD